MKEVILNRITIILFLPVITLLVAPIFIMGAIEAILYKEEEND